MAKVHSNSSVRRLIESLVTDYIKDNPAVLEKYYYRSVQATDFPQPRSVTHARDRMSSKQTVQQLPYLYQSPLI